MDCQVVVRAFDGVWRWSLDEWMTAVVVASLSSEPETFEELRDAVARYVADTGWLAQEAEPLESLDVPDLFQPWCVIDLIGRAVLGGGGYELLDRSATYRREDDEEEAADDPPLAPEPPPATGHGDHCGHAEAASAVDSDIIWTNLPYRWLLQPADEQWRELLEQRATARRAEPRIDARSVLFGPPLYEFIAQRVVASQADFDEFPAEETEAEHELIRGLHVEWMMTPRLDLGERTPRETLLDGHQFVQSEIESRARQWSRQGIPPRPLLAQSATYRLGGFSEPEIVTYFDLVRASFHTACRLVRQDATLTAERLAEQLPRATELWLDQPLPDDPSLTPNQIFTISRQRLPIEANSSMLDHDCPICRAEKDGLFGPTFVMFGGYHPEMDEDFAFSLLDRSDWESLRDQFDSIDLAMEQRRSALAGIPEREGSFPAEDDPLGSVWKSTYSSPERLPANEISPAFARLMLSFPLAEIIDCVRKQPEGRPHVEAINAAFDSFRRATTPQLMRQHAVLLRDALEQASQAYPELLGRSADFQSLLDEMLRAAHT